jgi:hypothetical protein
MRAGLRYPILAASLLLAGVARGQHPASPPVPRSTPAHAGEGGPPGADAARDAARKADSIAQAATEHADAMSKWADSLAEMGTDLSKLSTERRHMRSDQFHHIGDSIRAAMDQMRAAIQQGVRAGHHMRGPDHLMGPGDTDAGHHQGSLADLLGRLRGDPDAIGLPPADSFVAGGLAIAAGDQHAGTAATVNGNLDVFGMVNGNAVAIDGDVILHPGSHVTGSAFAAGGRVRGSGLVDGEIRYLEGPIGAVAVAGGHAAASASPSRLHDFRIAFSMSVLLMLLGIGILTFAEEPLDQVTTTLAERFGKSAWYGVVGEIAALPALLVLIVGLAITLVGILAIPFATAGYFVLLAGAATLGLVAVAQSTGAAVLRTSGQAALTPRGAQLRAIVFGSGIYGLLWMITAVIGSQSTLGFTVRGVVVVVTAVAITVGFGAVIVWRFELRRARRQVIAPPTPATDPAVWVTPTPVTGVAAARRPTPPAGASTGSST